MECYPGIEQRTENREQRIIKTVDLCVKSSEIEICNAIASRYAQESEHIINTKQVECAKFICAMNYKRVDETNLKVAKTLCARDYKGFGTGYDTMNGVVEICT